MLRTSSIFPANAFWKTGALAALLLCGPGIAQAPAAAVKPALTVTVAEARRSDWPATLAANGNIAAWDEAVVGAEANGLRLAEVRVNVGDRVRRGQVLAVFADDTSRAELAQLAAAVSEAEAALAEARVNAERGRALQDTGALPAQQIQQYLAAEQLAQARLNAAKAAHKAGELRLGFTRVLAPDEGVISSRTATVGSVTGAGQELFRLIRKGRLEWRAEVQASDLDKIKAGQAAQLSTPTGARVDGKVRAIAPTVDTGKRSAIVYVDLAANPSARAGMFASGEFTLQQASVLSVPQQAVVVRDGFSYVMRLRDGDRVEQVKIQPGRRVQDRVEVRAGVREGDRVVASGGAFLSDGDSVRIVAGNSNSPAISGDKR